MSKIQSVEPQIAHLVNGWLQSYKVDFKLEQESLNQEIDSALNEYFSKSGGNGGNRPDAKLLLQSKELKDYPVLIEYKGYKDKLVKLDDNGQVESKNSKGYIFKNINSYAVNGAVHYANALLHYTKYTDIIAIGVTGYVDETNTLKHEIGVYYVSKDNFGIGQEVDKYSDLSFLKKQHFDKFLEKVHALKLTQKEIDDIKAKRENELSTSLVNLNNDIFQNEKGLTEQDRVYLVAASIMATIGIEGKVAPLDKSELKSSNELHNRDGDIIIRKIESFLRNKKLPEAKQEMVVQRLKTTLAEENINKVENGETQVKRVFSKIVDDLGIYYKIGLTTDFTGMLFNEMYSWLGFSQDKLNDVVLTPSYVATLMAKLTRVNKDSFVWDFATGSAGLLVAAMNEMLQDAKNRCASPDEFQKKSESIKRTQLLGIEVLPSISMLAILNMILMGDGSSNILTQDSLKEFERYYGFVNPDDLKNPQDSKFHADAFVLNPPYSAPGNGFVFVEKALGMMHSGWAAILIQENAGNGNGLPYTKNILEHSSLVASIKMADIFKGKSSVQTAIYVFKVGEPHDVNNVVKFIDFTNDGYTRMNRKKSGISVNLQNTDHAPERYEEIIKLVRYGKGINNENLNYYKDCYVEDYISLNGNDWTYGQHQKIDTTPTEEDFQKVVKEYLSWKVGQVLKGESGLGKQ